MEDSPKFQVGSPMKDPKSFFTPDQIRDIIQNTSDPSYKLLFYFLSRTGRRISEVVRKLKVSDIDFDNSAINFTILKRRKDTRLYFAISEDLLVSLKIHTQSMNPDQFVFPMSRQMADQKLKEVCRKIGIETVGNNIRNKPHLHLFRHSYGRIGATESNNPLDILKVKDAMGHAKLETTLHYLKYSQKEQREMVDKIDKVLKGEDDD